MNELSVPAATMPYLAVLLLTLAGYWVALAIMVFYDTDANIWPVRWIQRFRMAATLMPEMLRRRGIDVRTYLRDGSMPEIRAQIARCQGCTRRSDCRRCLRAAVLPPPRFEFCPNTRVVEQYLSGPDGGRAGAVTGP